MLTRRLALFLALMAPATAAARSTPGAHDFMVDQWTTAEGLPIDHVVDVAFTADGFAWIATVEGLIRFDGATFRPMDEAWISALGSRRIAGLVTHPGDGALCIMAEERAVVALRRGQAAGLECARTRRRTGPVAGGARHDLHVVRRRHLPPRRTS